MHAKPNHMTSRPVYATKDIVIPPESTVHAPIKVKGRLPRERDYLFAPVPTASFVDCHLVDTDFSFVPVTTPSPYHHTFKRYERVGTLDEADYTMACAVAPDMACLAQSHDKDTALPPLPRPKEKIPETVLENGIRVYGDGKEAEILAEKVLLYCRNSGVDEYYELQS